VSTTTITLEADTRDRLGRLQLDLRRGNSGRSVAADAAVQFLLNALEELPSDTYLRLIRAQFGPGEEQTG
jgi:hypothetical protein